MTHAASSRALTYTKRVRALLCRDTGVSDQGRASAPTTSIMSASAPRLSTSGCARPAQCTGKVSSAQGLAVFRSAAALLCTPPRAQRTTRLHGMPGARSLQRLQSTAAAARPKDCKAWREATAKSVFVQHASAQAHHIPAATACIHRPCVLQAVRRPSDVATAPNVELAGLGLSERTLSAGVRRAHCGRNRGCARGWDAHRSTSAAARALRRDDTASAEQRVSAEGICSATTCCAPFALKPRQATQFRPSWSEHARLGPWRCQQRTLQRSALTDQKFGAARRAAAAAPAPYAVDTAPPRFLARRGVRLQARSAPRTRAQQC